MILLVVANNNVYSADMSRGFAWQKEMEKLVLARARCDAPRDHVSLDYPFKLASYSDLSELENANFGHSTTKLARWSGDLSSSLTYSLSGTVSSFPALMRMGRIECPELQNSR